jgi:exonuclease III
MDTLRIATLNNNGLSFPTRQDKLDAFVRLHNIDILLMQEVTNPFTLGFQGYTIHYNIGTSRRGTAILTLDTIVVTNLFRMPSERAIVHRSGHYLSSTYMLPPEPPNDQKGRPSSTTTYPSSWDPLLPTYCWEGISVAY